MLAVAGCYVASVYYKYEMVIEPGGWSEGPVSWAVVIGVPLVAVFWAWRKSYWNVVVLLASAVVVSELLQGYYATNVQKDWLRYSYIAAIILAIVVVVCTVLRQRRIADRLQAKPAYDANTGQPIAR
jgi:hypothetical protein